MKKINNVLNVIIPKTKTNYFVYVLFIFGIIAGAIFFSQITSKDKKYAINQVNNFINLIQTNKLDSVQALIKSIITNTIIISIITILSFSLIGIPIVIIYVFFKGFISSFIISTFITIFKLKGVLMALIYVVFGQLISIVVLIFISIYSINNTIDIIRKIKNKQSINLRKNFKKILVVYLISICFSIIGSIIESYLYPIILKLIL